MLVKSCFFIYVEAMIYLLAAAIPPKEEDWLHRTLFNLGDLPVNLWVIFKISLILICFIVLSRLTKRWIQKLGERKNRIQANAWYTLSRLSHYLILLLGFIIAGVAIGIDFTALAFVAGAAAVWIGFSLQTIFHNWISGILVLLSKNIRIGDHIQLESGERGTIMEIDVRSTLIKTLDGLEIVIPNSELISKKFTNWTLGDYSRRLNIPFRVAINNDKDKVSRLIIDGAKKIPFTISIKEPEIWLTSLSEYTLNFELVVWINEYLTNPATMSALSAYLWMIHDTLQKEKLLLSYPAQEVYLHMPKKEL